jgi:chromosome segregation ATPase
MTDREETGKKAEATAGQDVAVTKPSAPPPHETGPAEEHDDLERVRQLIMGGGDQPRQPIRDAEVKRLRDALFGTKMEEYERRFSDLRRDNDRIANDMRQVLDGLDELQEAQRERVEGVERGIKHSYEELSRSLEQVRSQAPLIQQVVAQSRQLQVVVQSLAEQVSELQAAQTRQSHDLHSLRSLIDQYRDQYERGIETVKREKRQAEDEIKAELRQVTDKLNGQKLDRRSLAAVFLEIATRMETGDATTDILASLVEPTKE